MQQFLSDLIQRMCDKSDLILVPGFDSTKTISWKATREAEKLNKEEYIPVLKEYISKENDSRKRDRAYFILGHIALNISDPGVASFIIERIAHEKDEEVLSSMLLNLKPLYKPKGTDLAPLLQLLSSEKWEVRQAAIQALNHCEDEKAEAALIGIVQDTKEEYDLLYAMEALRDSGTPRAVAALQKHMNSTKKEARALASAAVAAIRSRK